MNKTATIETDVLQTILTRLDQLTRDIAVMKEKMFETDAEYGSDMWWEKQTKESEKEFKKGKGIRFNSAKEAITWLNS